MNKNMILNIIFNTFVVLFSGYIRDTFLTKVISNHTEVFIIYLLLIAILVIIGNLVINKYFPPRSKN